MHTLPDPRHEAFASLRASGHDVASAYVHAGYSLKNVKQLSRKLVQNPSIQARIKHLQACLPRIAELHDHHCPSLLLMPETRHEMLVWLWQVMNGTREVRPAQMRAAGLYCRLRGWHLAKLMTDARAAAHAQPTAPASVHAHITPAEQSLLAMASRENIAHERTGQPRSPESLARFQTLMADQSLPGNRHDTLGRPLPPPAVSATSTAPVPQPLISEPSTAPAPGSAPATSANPSIPSKTPQESPAKSPPQPAEHQHLNLLPPPTLPLLKSPPTVPPLLPLKHPHRPFRHHPQPQNLLPARSR